MMTPREVQESIARKSALSRGVSMTHEEVQERREAHHRAAQEVAIQIQTPDIGGGQQSVSPMTPREAQESIVRKATPLPSQVALDTHRRQQEQEQQRQAAGARQRQEALQNLIAFETHYWQEKHSENGNNE